MLTPATPNGRKLRQRAIARTVSELPPVADMVRNIIDTVACATADEEHNGLTWYARAHAVAHDIGNRHGANVWQAAGVIAALSPQTPWHANIGYAVDAYANGADTIGHYDDAIRKADAIIGGAAPRNVLGGRKVRSFYVNIAEPTRHGRVTVDRHAVALAFYGPDHGHRWKSGPPVSPKLLERVGAYQYVAAAYRGAARVLGIAPHECQAIAWVTWRRLTGADVLDTGEVF